MCLLGMWSRVLYLVPLAAGVVELAVRYFGGGQTRLSAPKGELPEVIVRDYGLEECTFYELRAAREPDTPGGAQPGCGKTIETWEHLWREVMGRFESCGPLCPGGPVVRGRLGAASLLARCDPGATMGAPTVFAIVEQEAMTTPDHLRILSMLIEDCGLVVRDLGWRNVVRLDDPYYRECDWERRPGKPLGGRYPDG